MNIPEEPDDLPYINIVPMIDVVFAILTFFIMSSLFLSRSEGLPVNLPQAQTAQLQQQSKITVTVDDQGNVFLDRQPIEVEDLAERVKPLIGDQERLVVINADEKVEYRQVIAVMDQLRSVEGVKLGMSTRRP
ncbi:MAG: biopolymer transporter ExbD [Leptolyngbyaceae cyanobacterium RM2_2_4]|nr:biopolymer transporter ExbD [Leptolyngbyaceae cyanobacterium SM1_4_3]NJN89294.1 biopolymer transporter ExbD [Leptolyngbyaceae cyanobacterium SL_5_14]NJO52864.1 biopolymer transporter ExbD [Leptolyngbyaceae cyanobacterium RM2_2_4]NJO66649.1 biopolymer transporter ExbD [Leptolyngbyaceae cyanobacterium RM1_405_57]